MASDAHSPDVSAQGLENSALSSRTAVANNGRSFESSAEDSEQDAMPVISSPLRPESSADQLQVHADMAEKAVSLLSRGRVGKRIRASNDNNEEPDISIQEGIPPPKRSRHESLPDELPVASEGSESVFVGEYINLSDFRASGVFSAAALFRTPSAQSKKYTRPPMSRLFASLTLTPENFLHLQAAAKAYMLDPTYPERQTCVGNKAKGDNDLTKLRLFHCVRDFLDTDDLGETYFGESSEGAAGRGWSWPKDLNKVVGLVTPLLRRMVTNERQRQYALEARKIPSRKTLGRIMDARVTAQDPQSMGDSARGTADSSPASPSQVRSSTLQSPGVTRPYPLHIVVGCSNDVGVEVTHDSQPQRPIASLQFSTVQASLDCSFEDCPDLSTLLRLIESISPANARLESSPAPAVYVLLPRGLSSVKSNVQWVTAVEEVKSTTWLEGRMTVVVDTCQAGRITTNLE